MLFQRKKQRPLMIGVILGVLSFIFGGVVITSTYLNTTKAHEESYQPEKLPIRTLSIKVDESHQEELFDQLRKISQIHKLEFQLSYYENGNAYFLEMNGKSLEILAVTQPVNTTGLVISFFEKDPTNPPAPETVDELYNDLRTSISQVPSVEITEEN